MSKPIEIDLGWSTILDRIDLSDLRNLDQFLNIINTLSGNAYLSPYIIMYNMTEISVIAAQRVN